uniref:EOG090X0FVK n=1 Tax=Megafenestra aurita TaxID=2291010 RepID=A0A4Y7NJG0_9CRUS|nr:EOG090X0FVK [Megafenestra aurita]SVE92717.1 EOG090X0FVK [Megafenestra aurita]
MEPRQKEDSGDDDKHADWVHSSRRRPSSDNTSTVRQESSSDEEETIADPVNDSMDIDNVDPWAGGSDQNIPVAIDAGNPWESVPNSSTGEEEDNWANFSKADFDSTSTATPMEISDSVASVAVEELPQGSSKDSSTNERLLWKNLPAKPSEAYQPTLIEQVANIFTHGMCILPAVYAMWALVQRASTPTQFWAGLIYGVALILLFTISAAFHTTCLCNKSRMKDVLHRGDRAMIYIFIASSYFPWLTLMPNLSVTAEASNKLSSSLLPMILSWFGFNSLVAADLRWTVWFLAAMGILYQQIFHEKYKWLETLIYVLIGLLPSLPFVHSDEFQGVWELKVGGACYIVGLIFFKADGRIPLAHAIWHIHVALGASIHYYAVFTYLMG